MGMVSCFYCGCNVLGFSGGRQIGESSGVVRDDETSNIPRTYSVQGEGDSAFVGHLACIGCDVQIGSSMEYFLILTGTV